MTPEERKQREEWKRRNFSKHYGCAGGPKRVLIIAPSSPDEAKASLKSLLESHPNLIRLLDENGNTITGREPSQPAPPELLLPYSDKDVKLCESGHHLCSCPTVDVDFASIERRMMEEFGGQGQVD